MPAKHVIFLGAGASKGSGYPIANKLRLLISSRKNWENALLEYEKTHNLVDTPIRDIGLPYWDKHVEALGLFRNGGFATLDEFCKLAGTAFQTEIHGLRCVVRAALGLFNPEEHFEDSEYYGFVQALFKADLESLREDITILTYNYDPYLEFLLYRALDHRWTIARKGGPSFLVGTKVDKITHHENQLNAVTSGFYSPDSRAWLDCDKTKPAFCLLQLHGSICYEVLGSTGFEALFVDEPLTRAKKFFEKPADNIIPPVLFPWEIMTDHRLVEMKSFPFSNSHALYNLFDGIWEKARREVQAAEKISFIGLCMHDFLVGGLEFLFKDRKTPVEVVVANPDNADLGSGELQQNWGNLPHTPAYAVNEVLRKVAPDMQRFGIDQQYGKNPGGITLVRDFAEFIKTQMKPVG